MRMVLAIAALAVSASTLTAEQPKPFKVAMFCIKSGEQISGMNKICYYNCAGSEAAITVKSYELCPLNIDH